MAFAETEGRLSIDINDGANLSAIRIRESITINPTGIAY